MDYKEALDFIEKRNLSLSKKGISISLGLDRMRTLCEKLGNPQDKLQFIHVAGTNGKGSVSAYVSSILGNSGIFVGRFISPVVFEYRECIRFEDARGTWNISEELLAEIVSEVAHAMEQMKKEGMEEPTTFEMETAMAFLAFAKEKCQVVILEVGMGGREDATNVVKNVLASVITPISLDHMAYLGDTIERIATEKAGIIKPFVPVIAYPGSEESKQVIEHTCKINNSPFKLVKDEDMSRIAMDLDYLLFEYKGERYYTQMTGTYQMINASIAIETCLQLKDKYPLDGEQLMVGIKNAYWRGRFEVVHRNPLIIVDGAHNEAGAKALSESIEQLLPGRKIHGIMGVFKDKEYEKIVHTMNPYISDIITVTAPGKRGLSADELAGQWKNCGCGKVETANSVPEALKKVVAACEEEDAIILFGSLSLLSSLNYK